MDQVKRGISLGGGVFYTWTFRFSIIMFSVKSYWSFCGFNLGFLFEKCVLVLALLLAFFNVNTLCIGDITERVISSRVELGTNIDMYEYVIRNLLRHVRFEWVSKLSSDDVFFLFILKSKRRYVCQ